jgi:hypothetical protein
MKTYGRVEAHLHVFLTSALNGGELSISCPDRFTPRERAAGTHWSIYRYNFEAGKIAVRKNFICWKETAVPTNSWILDLN